MMSAMRTISIAVGCVGLFGASAIAGEATPLASVMPKVEDWTVMSWAEGFPSHTPSAPWRRVIETGRYALALDTDTLRVPHFGALDEGRNYSQAAVDTQRWLHLPAAELALSVIKDGKTYRCVEGGAWSRFKGPRLIDSGRFMQRADVTDLKFAADDGTRLNVESRFETAAWPDRLALSLFARPGLAPFPVGEPCFGRVGGGFGFDGTNHLEIPHSPELDTEKLTLELWAFIPTDYRVSDRTPPWLVCKNQHEQAQGNYGILLVNGHAQARMNIGGGRDNAFIVDGSKPLKIGAWNHLAMSYDGDALRLYLDGEAVGECKIGRKRVAGHGGLAFGRRQDNSGDGYHFRGAVDEIGYYNQALTHEEISARYHHPDKELASVPPVHRWSFAATGKASDTRPSEIWSHAAMEIKFKTPTGELKQRWDLPDGDVWTSPQWHEVALAFDPVNLQPSAASPVTVAATEFATGGARPVAFDAVRGWHRIDLDGIEPIVPAGPQEKRNDAIERVKLVIRNPSDTPQVARLLFEKTATGFRQRFGAVPTGISAMLRTADGQPSGIPVQLSKDWHNHPEAGVYSGQWFHGFSLLNLPAKAEIELEFTLCYGHWGGVAAASHAQLCLIGWGSNQLWDQSALGCWGESICYEPDQAQGACGILDVRPLMVDSMGNNKHWGWTSNVGGGDFFRLFNPLGDQVMHSAMRTVYHKQGPCLTEVTYSGRMGVGIEHSETVSIARTDDLVRGVYRLHLAVKQPVDFSRFAIFQVGADTYNYTGERKMAVGDADSGLVKEWATQWGGNTYRTSPLECKGRMPWVSMHEGGPLRPNKDAGAWANRGFVIRSWKARLGGKDATPWVAEHGVSVHGAETSTMDLVPPPGVMRLGAGDFIEATIEHIIVPQFAQDYYGPNEKLRTALKADGNTWRMIQREAAGNERKVEMKTGKLTALHPAVTVRATNDSAEFTLSGGLGYVPISFTGLASPVGLHLIVDDKSLNQSVHGNDYWQTDYDAGSKTWSLTFNVPIADRSPHTLRLVR